MHSSHTGWSSPTGNHSVIRRRAQRSAGRQPLHTTKSFSGIGMAAACWPKVAHKGPVDEGGAVNVRLSADLELSTVDTVNLRTTAPRSPTPRSQERYTPSLLP